MKLFEIFDKPLPYTLKQSGRRFVGQFETPNGVAYIVTAHSLDDDTYYDRPVIPTHPILKQIYDNMVRRAFAEFPNLTARTDRMDLQDEVHAKFIKEYPSFEILFRIDNQTSTNIKAKDELNIYNVSNTGNELDVFSTVFAMIKEIIASANPAELEFSASYDDHSRVKLYRRMVSVLSRGSNYVTHETADTDEYQQVFALLRKDIAQKKGT